MANIYRDSDITTSILKNKIVAVIGFGSQGCAQASNLRDSSLKTIIGLRPDGESKGKAEYEQFDVYPIEDAVCKADIIHILIPDEIQKEVYEEKIGPYLSKGKTVSFSSGFSIHFRKIIPPEDINVILMAPKGIGPAVRSQYLAGSGVPGLIGVHQDVDGYARTIALEMAKACGFGRVGILETTMQEEVETDLFGEQSILVGGLVELMSASYKTLVDAGYQEENAYIETIYELKLIIDLVSKAGIEGMIRKISNTAKFGWALRGREIIDKTIGHKLRKTLMEIRNKKFIKKWDEEYANNMPLVKKRMNELEKLPLIETGKRIRKMFGME